MKKRWWAPLLVAASVASAPVAAQTMSAPPVRAGAELSEANLQGDDGTVAAIIALLVAIGVGIFVSGDGDLPDPGQASP